MKICWHKDKKVGIFFNKIPDIVMRFPLFFLSEEENKEINKKPFINQSELKVELIDYLKNKKYKFTIPQCYTWDGASIPRFFWRLIDSKTDNKFLVPSLIHDVLCENHNYIDNDRYFSTLVFERLLYVSKVNSFNRWLIKHSVDNYQKFCRW